MLDRLKTLFAVEPEQTGLRDEHALPMAAAMLLLEVAWADQDITEIELGALGEALRALFDLPRAEAEDVLRSARREHEDTISFYEFTRTINESLDPHEKRQLVLALWQLALADDLVDKHEEYMIRRIADLLYVPHREFIDAKLEARAARRT